MTTEENAVLCRLSQTEGEIRGFLGRADYKAAATTLLEAHADELLGYLVNYLRDRELALEAFSLFAQDLWQGLPQLTLQSTARAWAYALARNAARRMLDRDLRKQRRNLPLSDQAELSALIAQTRQRTPPYLRTENKSRIALLRERLSEEERELIALRIDRGLDWQEIAQILAAPEDDLATASARYRKRFQSIKRKLAKWLQEERTPGSEGDD